MIRRLLKKFLVILFQAIFQTGYYIQFIIITSNSVFSVSLFKISYIMSYIGYRHLRIWSRAAVLQYTGENIEGLEGPVCWS